MNLSTKLNNVNRADNIRDKEVTCQVGLPMDWLVLELVLGIENTSLPPIPAPGTCVQQFSTAI